MKWIQALKLWNSEHNKGTWCVPRKGSPEHAVVKSLMGETKEGKEAKAKAEAAEEMATVPTPKKKVTIQEEEIDYDKMYKEERLKEIGVKSKKTKVKAFLKKLLAKSKAKKAAAAAAAAVPKRKTHFPLVSKDDYKKNLELLKLILKNSQASYDNQKKPKASDKDLYDELQDHFVRNEIYSYQVKLFMAFLNGLSEIYTNNTVGKIDWGSWFDASKTGQEYGNQWMATDNCVFGAVEKYFNIYASEKGTLETWGRQTYGYFFGFASSTAEAPAPAPAAAVGAGAGGGEDARDYFIEEGESKVMRADEYENAFVVNMNMNLTQAEQAAETVRQKHPEQAVFFKAGKGRLKIRKYEME